MGINERQPVLLVAPVADTTAGQWTFVSTGIDRAVRFLNVYNTSGVELYLGFNGRVASASDFDMLVPNSVQLCGRTAFYGVDEVEQLSIWVPSGGDVDGIRIGGI